MMNKCDAFFWCDREGNYCAIILDKTRRERIKEDRRRTTIFCREYRSPDIRHLRKLVRSDGYTLPRDTKTLCETAPISP